MYVGCISHWTVFMQTKGHFEFTSGFHQKECHTFILSLFTYMIMQLQLKHVWLPQNILTAHFSCFIYIANSLYDSADFDDILVWLLWLIFHFTTTCCLQTYFVLYCIILILQKAKVRIAFFVLTIIVLELNCWHFLWNGNLRFRLDLIASVSQKGRKFSLISIPFIILI